VSNKQTVTKKHSDHRTADQAKAGKRHRTTAPPSPQVDEKKAKWVAQVVMSGQMTLDDAYAQVKPNKVTQEQIEKFLLFVANKQDINPVVRMRIVRYV
jgi:hypothetical protein